MRTLFDRAGEHGNRVVDFFGAQLTLPPEGRSRRGPVQRYVDEVLAQAAVRERWPARGPLAVRARRGATAAHYERADDGAVIAVPHGRARGRCANWWCCTRLPIT